MYSKLRGMGAGSNAAGWGNNELEVYSENNVAVNAGQLAITANFDGTDFLSGRIRTLGLQEFVPSVKTPNGIRVEASIQLPTGDTPPPPGNPPVLLILQAD